MRCPYCSEIDDRVVESRIVEEGIAIRRRRECSKCHRRFTTYERVSHSRLMVLKRSGAREPFDRGKIKAGMLAALKNRPVSESEVEEAAVAIEEEFRLRADEVSSTEIGVAVLEKLMELDGVAYLRFASVYKNFDHVDDFGRELRAIKDGIPLIKEMNAENDDAIPPKGR
jgi:transcriptional repressor NrdR